MKRKGIHFRYLTLLFIHITTGKSIYKFLIEPTKNCNFQKTTSLIFERQILLHHWSSSKKKKKINFTKPSTN